MTKWWQWNIAIPKDQHPESNPNVTKCPVGESGQVSFLTHSYQGGSQFTCPIPAAHAILIPISSGECTTEEANSNNPADLIKCASEGDKYLTYRATVDGLSLNGLDQNYTTTKIFNMTVPSDNAFEIKPGTFNDGVGGYFAFLKPLPIGEHNVVINARVINPVNPSFNYNYHVVYLLNVK
jgi:hypothetical protein